MTDVIVVGAGLAGLVAAQRLQEEGRSVVLLDKGRGPGGRMATRWLDVDGGRATFDHGAQFITVRSDRFAAIIEGWPVHVWHHGPATARSVEDDPASASPPGDGHPRYVGDDGMNAVAKHLARDLDVRRGDRVGSVGPVDGGWQVTSDHGVARTAPAVVVTAPVPQAAAMLPAGLLGPDVAALSYEPTLALLVATDGPPARPAVQFDEGPVRYLADNADKGISEVPAVTVHAHGAWSTAHLDDDPEDVADALWGLAAPWLGDVRPLARQVKRWRYAQPTEPHPDRAVQPEPGLVLAGDAFGGAKVEGAVLSGLAAADLLLA